MNPKHLHPFVRGEDEPMIRYTCPPEALPLVEHALTTHSYTVDVPLHKRSDSLRILIMNQGIAYVFLLNGQNSAQAEVEVYGMAQSTVARLLEEESIPLSRSATGSAC
jgi:hypothetical protein